MGNLRNLTAIPLMLATLLFSCGNGAKKQTPIAAAFDHPTTPPKHYTYRVVNTYPHNPTSYTQGLYWDGGYLYESTGQYGKSKMVKTELETGNIIQSHLLAKQFFGEGAVRLGDKIYQITWRESKAFVYDAQTLKPLQQFKYRGEGWGITTDGTKLYMSDGTDKIKILNPETFETERTIAVKSSGNIVEFINELEWIEGEIWANIYTSNFIARIDPATGVVTGVVDLSGILPKGDIKPETDVLNGIAYDKQTKRIFVTGKNWSKLFEIEVIEKGQ